MSGAIKGYLWLKEPGSTQTQERITPTTCPLFDFLGLSSSPSLLGVTMYKGLAIRVGKLRWPLLGQLTRPYPFQDKVMEE